MNQNILVVPLYSVKLVRDALQQNMITVPKHEMPLLRKAHNNGALDDIAGICNEKRNVFGMMPHPERACNNLLGNTDGRQVFNKLFNI